jgi:O-antigen/teichoic acid export membrane protein
MIRRIILGVGANAFSQVVNIGIQVVSVPLFLKYWDTSTYGSWLLVSALPAYLAMSDLGIVGAAGNNMIMAIGKSDIGRANVVYQSAQLFVTVICCTLALIGAPILFFMPMTSFMTMDMRSALAALSCCVLLNLHGSLADAVFKATGRYAFGTMLGQLIRISEWVGCIIGLILFRTFVGVALCGLLGNAVGNALRIYFCQKGGHGLMLGFRLASKDELLLTIKPALSFTTYTLSNALNFQGMTLLVGVVAGSSAVTLFNSQRTLARLAVQVSAILSHAIWPEFARLFGESGMSGVYALYLRAAALSGVQAIVMNLAIFFVSPWLLQTWTHGRVETEPTLMALLLTWAAIGGLWHVPRVLLMATNQHFGISNWSLAVAFLSIALGWIFSLFWQVSGIGAAMLVSECFMATICAFFVHRAFMNVRSLPL